MSEIELTEEQRNADILEYDNSEVVGYGSHRDYGYYDVEVMNGDGYYDEEGHFHRYQMPIEL